MEKKSYANTTLRQYLYIQDALLDEDLTDEQKTAEYIRILFNTELNDIPIYKLSDYYEAIKFLSKPVEKGNVKKSYILNGVEYVLTNKIEKLTAAQYLDFINYTQQDDKEYEKIISCFLIPAGHKYNDGYDIEKVWNDILDYLDIESVTNISFFFLKQFLTFTNRTIACSMWEVMKMKGVTMKQKWIIIRQLYTAISNMEHLIS